MNSIRVRFSIGPQDERLDLLRQQLASVKDKRLQTKFVLETLIFKRLDASSNQEVGSLTFSVDLIINEYSPGLGNVFEALNTLTDHQSRVVWLRRKLISICTSTIEPTLEAPRGQMRCANEADLNPPSTPAPIASTMNALPTKLAAKVRKTSEQFQNM